MASKDSLSIDQVAEVLGCHRMTVYRMVHSGRLPAFRVGRLIRIAKVDLLAYRDRNKYRRREAKKAAAAQS